MKISNTVKIKTKDGVGDFNVKKFHKRYDVLVKKKLDKNEHYYIFQQIEELNKQVAEDEVLNLYKENYEYFSTFRKLVTSSVEEKSLQNWILNFIEVKENISLIKESFALIKSGGFNKETQEGALVSISERKQNLIDCLKVKLPEAKTVFGNLNIISIDRTESFVIRK